MSNAERKAGVPVTPEYPEPTIPLPEREPIPGREPGSFPWMDPDAPGRKVSVPPERPQPGPPVESPERS